MIVGRNAAHYSTELYRILHGNGDMMASEIPKHPVKNCKNWNMTHVTSQEVLEGELPSEVCESGLQTWD